MIVDRYTGWDISLLKNNREILVNILTEAGSRIKGNSVSCPFHDDRHPSAGIYSANGEGYRFKCHSCQFNGSVVDVIARLDGLDVTEVIRRLNSKPQKQSQKVYPDIEALKAAMPYPIEDIYQYICPNTGKIEMLVFRLITPDGKTFRQARPCNGGYIQEAPEKPWPLYMRKQIQSADTVVVCEGEKKCKVLFSYGIAATTSPCGALKAECADWIPLAGKNVILWPDNDEPGRQHMRQIEGILEKLEPTPRISIIEPADLDLHDKEDAVDFIKQLETLHIDKAQIQAAILETLNKARPKGIAEGVNVLIEDTIAGRRLAVKWTWSCIGGLTKALLPGTVTILCGGVGASKSFMLLESGAYWHRQGIKLAIHELEESREFHLSRCLAQLSGNSEITDPDWIKDNPEQARQLFADHKAFLDTFGACIYASPDAQPTLTQLAEWVRARAKAHCRIIAIDPVTAAAHKGRSVWEEDNAFLHDIKRSADDYHCSIILVTHPIKAVSCADITQLAGGAAYQRFAQTILWLESHEIKTNKVKFDCGTSEAEHNRTLHILKARNGKGQGIKLACNFESESLTLKEIGLIVKRKKTE